MSAPNIYWRHSRSLERAVVAQTAAGLRGLNIGSGALSATLHLRPLPRCAINPLLSMRIQGTVDGEASDLFMPVAAFERCLDWVAPGLSAAKLDPATAALVCESALAEPLDQLEAKLGCKITFSHAEMCREKSPRWSKPDIALRLDMLRSLPMTLYAFVPASFAQKVYSTWMKENAEGSFTATVSLAVRAGVARLGLADRAALQPDDILVLDDCLVQSKKVCLVADETNGACASISGTKMTLLEPMQPLAGSWLAHYAANKVSGSHKDGTLITADLARRSVSFQELESIDFESAIDLPQGIDGVVGLYDGPRRIASGRLVITGSAIAVRVMGLHPNG